MRENFQTNRLQRKVWYPDRLLPLPQYLPLDRIQCPCRRLTVHRKRPIHIARHLIAQLRFRLLQIPRLQTGLRFPLQRLIPFLPFRFRRRRQAWRTRRGHSRPGIRWRRIFHFFCRFSRDPGWLALRGGRGTTVFPAVDLASRRCDSGTSLGKSSSSLSAGFFDLAGVFEQTPPWMAMFVGFIRWIGTGRSGLFALDVPPATSGTNFLLGIADFFATTSLGFAPIKVRPLSKTSQRIKQFKIISEQFTKNFRKIH